MEVEDATVYFFRGQRSDDGTIVHELQNMHITSIDTPDKKVLCKSKRHYGISLSTTQGHRKLYFLNYELMLQGIDFLLQQQGFTSRLDQYDMKKKLPGNDFNECWLSKHKLTGEAVIVKMIGKHDAMARELAMSELSAQQHCRANPFVIEFKDYFEDETHIYLVSKYVEKNLRDDATREGNGPVPEAEACFLVS